MTHLKRYGITLLFLCALFGSFVSLTAASAHSTGQNPSEYPSDTPTVQPTTQFPTGCPEVGTQYTNLPTDQCPEAAPKTLPQVRIPILNFNSVDVVNQTLVAPGILRVQVDTICPTGTRALGEVTAVERVGFNLITASRLFLAHACNGLLNTQSVYLFGPFAAGHFDEKSAVLEDFRFTRYALRVTEATFGVVREYIA